MDMDMVVMVEGTDIMKIKNNHFIDKSSLYKVMNIPKSNFKLLPTLFLIWVGSYAYGQTYSHHNQQNFDPIIRALYQPSVNLHTSIRPYRLDQVETYYSTDSLIQRHLRKPSKRLNIFERFIHDDFLRWDSRSLAGSKISVRINPLFNFQLGKEMDSGKKTWINTRGAMIEGELGENLSFYVDIYENQGVYAGYMNDYIYKRDVLPGQGRVKRIQDNERDYSQSTGYLSFNAGEWINLQAGYGKNFIGDGYRSLLLSDNTYSYPYVKMTATFMKVQYMAFFGQFQHIPANYLYNDDRLEYKYGAFHYLSWNIGKRFTIGLFESVIYAAQDSTGYRGVDMMYLMPLMVFRPAEHAVGSPDNMTMGVNMKFIPWKDAALYGQFVMGEFKQDEVFSGKKWWANKQGFQLGFKNYNFLGIQNLDFQTEYNQVRPYTYSHYEAITNYGHLNQELAHPLGANFRESVSFLNYRAGRWYFTFETMIGLHGKDFDNNTSFGGDIYIPNNINYRPYEYGHTIGQGLRTNIYNLTGSISFLINPKNNMNIALEIRQRKHSNPLEDISQAFLNFSLRTSLNNFYWDF